MAGNKEILGRMYEEAINGGNLDLIDDLLADDFVEHEAFPGLEPNREGVKRLFAASLAAFGDFRMEPWQYVEEGDLVVAWVQMTGTHQGEFMGVPASGNKIDLLLVDMVRIRDGRISEHWGCSDSMVLMQQLGAMPPPPQG